MAEAQNVCHSRDVLLENWAKRYGEAPSGRGLMQDGRLIELLTSENGSWTMIATDANGRSCILSAGETWMAVARPLMEPEA